MASGDKPFVSEPVAVTVPGKATLSSASTVCVMPLDPATPRSERSSNPFDTDVEANLISQSSNRKSCTLVRKGECQVWPGKKHWKEKAKDAKFKRSFTCLARLGRRQRIAAKIILVALVVAVAVGVGFGVSKPLGAPIWDADERTAPIRFTKQDTTVPFISDDLDHEAGSAVE